MARPRRSGESRPPESGSDRLPETAEERLAAVQELLRTASFRDLLSDLAGIPGLSEASGAAGEVVKGAVELVKFVFEPTKYEDFRREKKDDDLESGAAKQSETPANLPHVRPKIQSVRCVEKGWLDITIVVEASAGARNDDVTEVGLSLPSPDCRGFLDSQTHRFASEREQQSHTFTVRVKCSSLIAKSTNPFDVSLWVEATAVDDEGRVRRTRFRLSSPELDRVGKDCCTA